MEQNSIANWSRLAKNYRGDGDWVGFFDRLLDGVDLTGANVFDVGGGVGLGSTYALCKGAKSATLIEPEADGSQNTMLVRARKLRGDLGFDNKLKIESVTFQDFSGADAPFDVAILEASINHLDEDAVIKMEKGNEEWQRYTEIANKMASLLSPGATIMMSDCARRNFFGDIGMRNPMVPTIEWDKHQQPKIWAKLFAEAGFSQPKINWGLHSTLGAVGRTLLDNPLAFYFLSSYFILTMRYEGPRSS